jgi:O-antigen/teichoic acid export membrane protein
MIGARRGAKAYLIAGLVSMAGAAIRYILFVRIMSPEQLGLAATITLTVSFFDLVTDLGSDRFLVQDDSGDAPEALSTVHLFLITRGVLIAGLLVLLAAPLSSFYKSPQLTSGFLLLSAYPLIGAFTNADPRRQQRYNDFRPDSACTIGAEAAALIAAVLALMVTKSYFAAIIPYIVRASVLLVMSNILSKVRYHIGFSKEFASKISHFGGPLIFNGFALFFGGQGDRIVIARALSIKELGVYSAVSLLIYYPSAVLGRYLIGLQLPIVAASKNSDARRTEVLDLIAGGATLLSIGQAAGFAVVAPFVIPIIYGARFSQVLPIVAVIGVLQGSRFIRNWPTNVALGLGRSLPVLVGNIVRLIGFPMAILSGWAGLGLMGVSGAFAIGEVIAAVISVLMINRIVHRSWWHDLDRVAEFTICGVLLVLASSLWQKGEGLAATLLFGVLAFALTATLVRERRSAGYGLNLMRNSLGRLRRLPLSVSRD